MKRKRYLRPWIQSVLEINVLLTMGFFCSLYDIEICLPSILIVMGLLTLMAISALLLNRYGRYEDGI